MSIVTPFNTHAGGAGYVFDYQAEVENFYDAFPQHNDLDFIDLQSGDFITTKNRPLSSFEQLTDPQQIDSCKATFKKEFADGAKKQNSCLFTEGDYKAVLLNNRSVRVLPPEQEKAFAFDHETGHAVCTYGARASNRHLAECVADSYATIRHYQRFGMESTSIENVLYYRTFMTFVNANETYFTVPALLQVMQDAAYVDFQSLSPEDTATLASRYAAKYAMQTAVISDMPLKILSRISNENAHEQNNDVVRGFFKAISSTNSPDTLHWGSFAFEALVEGMLFPASTISFNGQEWQDMANSLKQKNEAMQRQGSLFLGIDQKHMNPQRILRRTFGR